ncbi:MAG TPA: hypothetical protein VGP15_02450 [Burkholderiales bacterium]|nr:hypothetical protein [Burkholderiales bacterium]
MLEDDEAPPGPLEADEPPVEPPVLLDDEPPGEDPLMLPVPEPELVPPELELDESEGELGEVDEDEDDPPGTTTVSFSFEVVVEEVDDPLGEVLVEPPGITVVVSFLSHADNANAPINTNR